MGDTSSLPARTALLAIGVMGRPHGVRGEITLRAFGSFPRSAGTLWLERDDAWRKVEVESARPAGDHWILRLRGVGDREAAAALLPAHAHVLRADLPPLSPGEFYVADTLGLEVRDVKGGRLGKVVSTFWNGAHDVAVIERDPGNERERGNAGKEGETLVPLVPTVVQEVRVAEGYLLVDWQNDEDAANDEDVARDEGDDDRP